MRRANLTQQSEKWERFSCKERKALMREDLSTISVMANLYEKSARSAGNTLSREYFGIAQRALEDDFERHGLNEALWREVPYSSFGHGDERLGLIRGIM
ncbi:hypothetical protein MA16_Dca005781 [Dendrobium catenatum]|uniref:Uncharacterized protein n=1 Tax=Dendrobium catenatum TaxID=906689 RepID=A0A2I0WX70_9ASPA|nr:hypothetical protein MA16_Dca005781 [Dendrobium catenatum]